MKHVGMFMLGEFINSPFIDNIWIDATSISSDPTITLKNI